MIWALAFLMTTGLALLLLWPLLRGADAVVPSGAHDRAVHRDQLAEIAREEKAGLIGAAEAEAARAEIARRMLAADRAARGTAPASAAAGPPKAALAVCGLLPIAALAFYALSGRPDLPAQPASDPDSPAQQMRMIRGMVDRLAQRLAQAPDDVEGWRRLAHSHRVLGDIAPAREAAARAARLAPQDPAVLAELADLHAPASADEALSPIYLDTLRRLLALRPDEPRALFFLGLDAMRRADRETARGHWQRLLAALPADAPLAREIRRRLDDAAATR
jgi:cytochrome c-type biogenesis protein CcmH